MGMGGMTTDAYAKYAAPSIEKKVEVAKTSSSMTVAELRNYVNPMTKYYDQLPAKAFINDSSISVHDKLNAIFGKLATGDDPNLVTGRIEYMLNEIRKAVS